jgi:hypothetical protein
MNIVQDRVERLHAKVLETISTEAPGPAGKKIRRSVCMPYPEDDSDLVFFYGEGVPKHADFDYGVSRLTELFQESGIESTFARFTKAAYEMQIAEEHLADLPEHRFIFLAKVCGFPNPPDTILSCPLYVPAVVTLEAFGGKPAARFLIL